MITALFKISMFAIITISFVWVHLLSTVLAYRSVLVTYGVNQTEYFPAITSTFGTPLPIKGLRGALIDSKTDGCSASPIFEAISSFQKESHFAAIPEEIIVMVSRGNCTFHTKVFHAQLAGASAVVVYDNDIKNWIDPASNKQLLTYPRDSQAYDGLLQMSLDSESLEPIATSSVFISYKHAQILKHYIRENWTAHARPLFVFIYGTQLQSERSTYLIQGSWPNAIAILFLGTAITSLCTLLLATAMIIDRLVIIRRRLALERRNRMSEQELHLIKCHTIAETDLKHLNKLICAICLEEFQVGDKSRDLLCKHSFHSACVDEWLITKHRSCPVCRTQM